MLRPITIVGNRVRIVMLAFLCGVLNDLNRPLREYRPEQSRVDFSLWHEPGQPCRFGDVRGKPEVTIWGRQGSF
jgi:hypothetical protein